MMMELREGKGAFSQASWVSKKPTASAQSSTRGARRAEKVPSCGNLVAAHPRSLSSVLIFVAVAIACMVKVQCI